jgi:hypothetical protein
MQNDHGCEKDRRVFISAQRGKFNRIRKVAISVEHTTSCIIKRGPYTLWANCERSATLQ